VATEDVTEVADRRTQSPTSLPFLDRSGSVQEARSKQQGRRFPWLIFEMLTSTRRLRVSEFLVALTHRTHSHRAIGVIASQRSRISGGQPTKLFPNPPARWALATL
jgi:hypothetical protein